MSKENSFESLMVVNCCVIDEIVTLLKDARMKIKDDVLMDNRLFDAIAELDSVDWLSNLIKIDFSKLKNE